MAKAIKEHINPIFGMELRESVELRLTQDEADYLAKLTRDFRILKEDSDRYNEINIDEHTQHTIHRQRIFKALSGVTNPS